MGIPVRELLPLQKPSAHESRQFVIEPYTVLQPIRAQKLL